MIRVTDEQARILADADPTVHIQIGAGRGVDVCLIADDLLDARRELAALRKVVEAAKVRRELDHDIEDLCQCHDDDCAERQIRLSIAAFDAALASIKVK